MADELASVNLLITGRVQGVFFRASTLEQAQAVGVTGWVKNCGDGSVEVMAEGPRYALERLIEWCKDGPPPADVENVSARWGGHMAQFKTFMIVR